MTSPKKKQTRKVKDFKPHRVNENVWFYVNEKTLHFVAWTEGKTGERKAASFLIKKSALKKYV